MPNKPTDVHKHGPGAKCCLGVTYFNRTLERNGQLPKCVGLAQLKEGEQDNDDVRMLGETTGDFQYVCVGYSSQPTDSRPSRQGQTTAMPFCEGVEIAVTEERVSGTVPGSGTGPLLRDDAAATLDHGSGAPLPPLSADPPNKDNSVQSRFRRQFLRNADSLLSAVTGERRPQLPVQLRKFDTVEDAQQSFAETASVNLLKMRLMAEFISYRTLDALKPFWERFGSEEETE